jgi:hypothetical protein
MSSVRKVAEGLQLILGADRSWQAGNEIELPFCSTTRHVRSKIFSAKVQFQLLTAAPSPYNRWLRTGWRENHEK